MESSPVGTLIGNRQETEKRQRRIELELKRTNSLLSSRQLQAKQSAGRLFSLKSRALRFLAQSRRTSTKHRCFGDGTLDEDLHLLLPCLRSYLVISRFRTDKTASDVLKMFFQRYLVRYILRGNLDAENRPALTGVWAIPKTVSEVEGYDGSLW